MDGGGFRWMEEMFSIVKIFLSDIRVKREALLSHGRLAFCSARWPGGGIVECIV